MHCPKCGEKIYCPCEACKEKIPEGKKTSIHFGDMEACGYCGFTKHISWWEQLSVDVYRV